MLKAQSPLLDDDEKLIHNTIGCCIAVHRELGPGLPESLYSRALCIEFHENGLAFEREQPCPVIYRGEHLSEYRLDFVVADEIVLEIKSVEMIAEVHHSQLIHYLRLSRRRVGLLVNFNVSVLRNGIVSKVL